MSLLSTVFSPVAALDRRRMVVETPIPPNGRGSTATWGMLYDVLEDYYQNNALYQNVQYGLTQAGVPAESLRGLRNPAFRCVEFYASKLWPGPLSEALPIRTRNQQLIPAIENVWRWSNWANKKQLSARYLGGLGDMFLKIVSRTRDDEGNELPVSDRRVFLEVIKARFVTELETEERGYVTHCRIDTPFIKPRAQRPRETAGLVDEPEVLLTRTELWSRANGTCRIWLHDKGEGYPIRELGNPDDTITLEEMGLDFIPIVHAPFRDVGENRGAAAYVYQLDKIDEINAQTTRLHKVMFRYGRPVWAILSNMVDATRRPMPSPRMESSPYTAPSSQGSAGVVGAETWLEGESVLYFPGLSKPELLIPDLQYKDFLDAIEASMRELEDDLPELIYYRVIREFQEASGRALSYMLSPAVDRVIEVRGNAETALIRANQIALTVGQKIGVFGTDIGRFDSPDPKTNFEHTFATRPVIPLSEMDIAEADRARTEALERKHNLGVPLRRLWMEMGYDEDEIAENEKWAEEEREKQLEADEEKLRMEGDIQAETAGKTEELKVEANPTPPGTPGRGAGRPRGTQQRGSRTVSNRA